MKIIDEIVHQELETDEHPHRQVAITTADLEADSRSPLFRLRRRIFIGMLLFLLLFGGAFSLIVWRKAHSPKGESANDNLARRAANKVSLAQPDLVTVEEAELKQIGIASVEMHEVKVDLEATARVGFNEDRQTPVYTPYAGRVVEILANKGDLVKAGQPLLIVESPELVSVENDLASARTEQDKARIALETAVKSAERARTLLSREAVAAKDVQLAEADLARAREDLRRADAAVALYENRLALFGKDSREIAQIEKQPPGAIDRRVVIKAPISGTIVDRQVGPGQYVKPDVPNPLFLIADLSSLWVLGDIYESFLPHIRVGTPVQISFSPFPEQRFPARISFINPTVDPVSRTIHVRAVVRNNGLLKPEMFARISFGTAVPQSYPAISSSAVITVNSRAVVLVEEGQGRFRRREIVPEREEDGYTLIRSGLKPGERVVTSGVLLLNNGVGKPPESEREMGK